VTLVEDYREKVWELFPNMVVSRAPNTAPTSFKLLEAFLLSFGSSLGEEKANFVNRLWTGRTEREKKFSLPFQKTT